MVMAPVAKKADYKANKLQENVDWESCQSKYLDFAKRVLGTVSYGSNRGLSSRSHGSLKSPGDHKAKKYSWQIQTGRGHRMAKWPRTGGYALL